MRRTWASAFSSLHTANLSWQTRVGKPKLVCMNGTKTGGKHVCKLLASNRNVFADCFYAVHTHQLDFANTSLPTLVCRVKAALEGLAMRGNAEETDNSSFCARSWKLCTCFLYTSETHMINGLGSFARTESLVWLSNPLTTHSSCERFSWRPCITKQQKAWNSWFSRYVGKNWMWKF